MMRSDEVQGSRSSKRRRSAKVSSGLPSPSSPSQASPRGPPEISGKESGLSWASEPELRLIDPHPVKDDPQLAGEGDLSPLGTSPLGHVHGPGLELRPSCNPRHDDVRGLEERNPDRCIAGAADGATSVGLAGLIFSRSQAEAGTHLLG